MELVFSVTESRGARSISCEDTQAAFGSICVSLLKEPPGFSDEGSTLTTSLTYFPEPHLQVSLADSVLPSRLVTMEIKYST